VVGALTSLLTATYMFRLVFLTFHGERRHDAPPEHPEEEEPAAHGHGSTHAADDHGHGHAPGGHLHDAPPAMALALIVLAVGSIFAGLVGVPHILGGDNRIERFLEPAFEALAMAPSTEFQVTEGRPGGAPAAAEPAAVETTPEPGENTEWLLMGLSVGIAAAGIGLAYYFWLVNRAAAARFARSAAGLYTLLLNKYYIDELYNVIVVRPVAFMALVLWKGADVALIDGSVNGVGKVVSGTSNRLRRLQTGSIRAYAASLFLGVVLILGWYLMR
jgi:NADH-quinone oxidoreductase subunit L